MSVHNGFTIEIYEFRHSLRTCLAHDAHDVIAMEVTSRSRTRRIEDDARMSPGI